MEVSYEISVKRARTATLFSFLLAGVAVSAWAPMVPLAKERTGLNEAGLGLILLCMGAGAIVTMPFIGPVIQKSGSKRIILISSILVSAVLPLLTIVHTPVLLGVALFVFGGSLGALDVAVNSQAVIVQDHMKRPVMSSFHGMFSLGGLMGAMIFGLLLLIKLSPLQSALLIGGLLMLLSIYYYKNYLNHEEQDSNSGPKFSLPKGPVIILGIFCFIVFLAEGALLDWSALFLSENRNYPVSFAGAGYAVFSVSMAVMRFTGDKLVHQYGSSRIVFWGGTIAAIGLLIAVLVEWQPAAMLGFLLIGIGAANIVPVLFSAAGSADRSAPGLALAAVTTMGYAGQLAGPALIGFAAHLSSLPVALGLLAGPLLLVAFTFGFRKQVSSAGA